MSVASASKRAPGRRWIPLLALAPLLALLAADAVMVVLAARSDPGLVADAPRRVGLARLAPGDELRLDLALETGNRVLRLRLQDASGAPVPAVAVEGRLERVTHAGNDRPLHFVITPDGAWLAELVLPDAGAWQVTAAARDAEGRSALTVVRLAP